MMALHVPHQSSERKRVKVYELNDENWVDLGTGFCTYQHASPQNSSETYTARLVVLAEEQPGKCIWEKSLSKHDLCQKQQETMIVWTDQHGGHDMALSFQEVEGCSTIWRLIDGFHQVVAGTMSPGQLLDEGQFIDPEPPEVSLPSNINLPTPVLGNLGEVEHCIRSFSQSLPGRESLVKYIHLSGYLGKLTPLVQMAEDFESLSDLHRLCVVIKLVLLLNDTHILEQAVSDEHIFRVVGALEYDPDFPAHKANHRAWLQNPQRFKEVVPITRESLQKKIHQTYRLQYFKDVALARCLDENTYSVLNTMIFYNQVDIMTHLIDDDDFMSRLFEVFTSSSSSSSSDDDRRTDVIMFIQQWCSIGKSVQPSSRVALYTRFVHHGLMDVLSYGLRHENIHVRASVSEILVAMIDHDPSFLRQTVYSQICCKRPLLMDVLIDMLPVEHDLAVKTHCFETLKAILDQTQTHIPQETREKASAETLAFMKAQAEEDARIQEVIVVHFYEHSADRLVKPLLELKDRTDLDFSVLEVTTFSYLVELLIHFIRNHQHRIKYFLMQKNIPQRVMQLLSSREKILKLLSVRFFRHVVGMHDEYCLKQLIDQNVFGPILSALRKIMSRDSLLSSAVLELFEFIQRPHEHVELLKYLVENFRNDLVDLSNISRAPTFHNIIQQYDESHGFSVVPPRVNSRSRPYPTPAQIMPQVPLDSYAAHWGPEDDEDDEEDDDYYDDDTQTKLPKVDSSTPTTSAAASKPLVDYASDDEDDPTTTTTTTTTITTSTPALPAIPDDPQDDVEMTTDSPRSCNLPIPEHEQAQDNTASSQNNVYVSIDTDDSYDGTDSATASHLEPYVMSDASQASTRPLEKRRRGENEDDDVILAGPAATKRRSSSSSFASSRPPSATMSPVNPRS